MLHVIEISGTPFEMGIELGKKARRFIRPGVAFYKKHWKKLTGISWISAVRMLRPTVKLTQQLLPKTWQELQGIGQGSTVGWQDLFVINSMEALERLRPPEKCTSILARRRQSLLLAHNEDWVQSDSKWLYLVKARPHNEPTFMCVMYGAWLQTYGLNNAGLAFVADSHQAQDARVGLSQTFIGREIMRCRSIKETVQRIVAWPRADGHTYVLVSETGEGIAVETTAKQHVVLKTSSFLVHTNFYQSPRCARQEIGVRTYSQFRCYRTQALLRAAKLPLTTTKLFTILADHQNYPQSVCCHIAQSKQDTTKDQTIASIVIDPRAQTMVIIQGNPCRGRPHTFSLP